MPVEEGSQQTPYPIEHPYVADPILPSLSKRMIPENVHRMLGADLARLGDRLVKEIRPLAPFVHPATLTQYNEFGKRVDRLQTSEGWRKIEEFAVQEVYNSVAFERKHGTYSRTFQFARAIFMTGDCQSRQYCDQLLSRRETLNERSQIICPMGVTDSSARLIELYGTDAMNEELLPRLLTRGPCRAYISGQWMTDRAGGSNVSFTKANAVPDPYILNGFKWFSSAAEGNMTTTANCSHSHASSTNPTIPSRLIGSARLPHLLETIDAAR
ncbi:hypothetical protein NUW54_g7917 [Trametes sanguinea]|uniref:Uncharacterized protein n=1 Tax=Trametes sanguinea TaxID=158606 RepID=A0ACC1PHH6_9APHY|nr:hypothetical protein NUW54_g7917 [Trametes sanguinea]